MLHQNLKITGIHGLGLWKVNNILKRYENIKLYTSKSEDIFKQVLEIS